MADPTEAKRLKHERMCDGAYVDQPGRRTRNAPPLFEPDYWPMLGFRLVVGAAVSVLVTAAVLFPFFVWEGETDGQYPLLTLRPAAAYIGATVALAMAAAGSIALSCCILLLVLSRILESTWLRLGPAGVGQLIGGAVATVAISPLWGLMIQDDVPLTLKAAQLSVLSFPALIAFQLAGAMTSAPGRPDQHARPRYSVASLLLVTLCLAVGAGAFQGDLPSHGVIAWLAVSIAFQMVTGPSLQAAAVWLATPRRRTFR